MRTTAIALGENDAGAVTRSKPVLATEIINTLATPLAEPVIHVVLRYLRWPPRSPFPKVARDVHHPFVRSLLRLAASKRVAAAQLRKYLVQSRFSPVDELFLRCARAFALLKQLPVPFENKLFRELHRFMTEPATAASSADFAERFDLERFWLDKIGLELDRAAIALANAYFRPRHVS